MARGHGQLAGRRYILKVTDWRSAFWSMEITAGTTARLQKGSATYCERNSASATVPPESKSNNPASLASTLPCLSKRKSQVCTNVKTRVVFNRNYDYDSRNLAQR